MPFHMKFLFGVFQVKYPFKVPTLAAAEALILPAAAASLPLPDHWGNPSFGITEGLSLSSSSSWAPNRHWKSKTEIGRKHSISFWLGTHKNVHRPQAFYSPYPELSEGAMVNACFTVVMAQCEE